MTAITHNNTQQQNQIQFKHTAFNIGKYLAREAVWDGDRCNWIGHTVENVNGTFQVVRQSFSRDFYNGTSGIAYFLALLLEHLEDPIIEETLNGTINQALSVDETNDNLGSNYGFHGGRIGIAYTLIEIGKMRKNPTWTKAGFTLLDKICATDIQKFELDIISGVAGGIPVLINYFKETNQQTYLTTAIKCGEFLLNTAEKTNNSWSWKNPHSAYALTGYSHGNAGIAVALLELYNITQDARFYTAAMFAFNYERLLYNPSVQNWPDLRELTAETAQAPNYGETWCHGAPGIALSRLRAWKLTGDTQFKQEAELALATTYKNVYTSLTQHTGFANYSLCHGIAGNADILLEGGLQLGNPLYTQIVEQVGVYGVEQYEKTGLSWPSGVNDPSGVTKGMGETPGFMLGLAGTGYFYLRIAFPSKINSHLIV